MTLRVGIISANWGAFAHLPAWRALPGVEVVGICTSRQESAEAAAQRFQIARPFWDAEAMIRSGEIDIVDCGTRPSVRHPMVLTALQNGVHVYNGIPCSADIDRARELRDAWKAGSSVAIVDAFSQWIPTHRLAREMIDDGFLGRPFAGTCSFQMSLFNQPHPQFPYNWFWQSGLGVSAMRNLGSHALHMLLFLFGEVEELVADDRQLLDEWKFPDGSVIKPETNDFVSMLLRFTSGMTLQLQVSWSATLGQGWSLEAFGSNGRIAITAPSFPTADETVLRAGALGASGLEEMAVPDRLRTKPGVDIDPAVQPQAAIPMAFAMHDMVEAIRGNGPPSPDFAQAWNVERLLEAARRSTEQRRWVRIEEIE